MLLPFLAAGVLTLAAAPAQAGTSAQPAAAAASTAATPAAAPVPTADANRRICRRFAATGSMIPTRRECRTAAEWDRLAEAARAQGQDVVERARSGMAGN